MWRTIITTAFRSSRQLRGVWSEWKKSGGGSGSGLGEFSYPRGVAIDGDGNLYVADSKNHRIQKLDAVSGVWSEWKKSGGGTGGDLGGV
ncbi:hypothetical protein OMP40_34585 [Cohnella rhizosphaerae]|uniref:6-bladed beta-propeller n=1 Tax=Cohnella rhizosphaerae TaxID=1457232 RepID=A0A9X4QWN2_9BACL|nr:hypothetical protein [Cohnella rhizosphaerae]MDG0813839.1 hypothetical protein [Cohnella rhizosphaerae]